MKEYFEKAKELSARGIKAVEEFLSRVAVEGYTLSTGNGRVIKTFTIAAPVSAIREFEDYLEEKGIAAGSHTFGQCHVVDGVWHYTINQTSWGYTTEDIAIAMFLAAQQAATPDAAPQRR